MSRRRNRPTGRRTVNMALDTSSLNEIVRELGERMEAAIRPAAQAGTEVVYQAVLKNVDAIGSVTGNLRSAIYQAYSESNSGPLKATYHVSWNAKKAPHGGLIEYGHIQRYASRTGEDGKWHTLVRPSKRGQPRPDRRAPQSEKDAYYVLRKGGPVQVAARPFLRPAYYQAGGPAVAAMRAVLLRFMTTGHA